MGFTDNKNASSKREETIMYANIEDGLVGLMMKTSPFLLYECVAKRK